MRGISISTEVTSFDITYGYSCSFMSAHDSSLVNPREPMGNSRVHSQFWVTTSTVGGVRNIPRQPMGQRMNCPFQEPPRIINQLDVMTRTVGNVQVAMHHDPPPRKCTIIQYNIPWSGRNCSHMKLRGYYAGRTRVRGLPVEFMV